MKINQYILMIIPCQVQSTSGLCHISTQDCYTSPTAQSTDFIVYLIRQFIRLIFASKFGLSEQLLISLVDLVLLHRMIRKMTFECPLPCD